MEPQFRFLFLKLSCPIYKLKKDNRPRQLNYTAESHRCSKTASLGGLFGEGGWLDGRKKKWINSVSILYLDHSVPFLKLLARWPSFHLNRGWTFPAQIESASFQSEAHPLPTRGKGSISLQWSSDKPLERPTSDIKDFPTSVRISTTKPYPSRQF